VLNSWLTRQASGPRRVLRILVCAVAAVEVGELALRTGRRPVQRGRAFAAMKTAMNGSTRTLLAAHQHATAAAQPMAVGALRWGRRFFPAPARMAQTTHEVASYG